LLERLFALETFGIKLGLENISTLCAALGHPERSFRSIHIAGTNGKGSVTAMVHAALRAEGIRAARYTSPHLTDLSERFVILDAPVDEEQLATVAADVLACIDRLRSSGTLTVSPTFFEATTAIAFELFRRASIDVAVIEVGLGGRFDSTNVITPVVTAITTVGLDHQEHLGNTVERIAFEKAGIAKPGVPLVVGRLVPEAQAVVAAVAGERHAPLIEAAAGVELTTTMESGRARVTMRTPLETYGPSLLALRGEHQIDNALVAVRLLEQARGAGIQISRQAIEQGLTSVDWPARLEILSLGDGKQIVLDAAHNAEGATALASYLQQWHPDRPPLVLGVMRDKDVDEILRVLLPVTAAVVIATAAPTSRAMPADELAQRIVAAGHQARAVAEPIDAVREALQAADTVCVAGSIFLAGAVRDRLCHRAILH
jgi:dihydrofolate synthase/folylpolyglutamate synthase